MKKGPFKLKSGNKPSIAKMAGISPMKEGFGKKLIKKVGHYASGALSAGLGLATSLPLATATVASKALGTSNTKGFVKNMKKGQKHAAGHFKKGNEIKLFKKNK